MKLTRALVPFFVLVLLGQGCLGGSSNTATGPDGGVFRTKNAGVEWKQLKVLNLGTKIGSIANVGTASVAFDPQDPLAVYVGTSENGLLASTDGGESWLNAKGMSAGRVNAVGVDAKDKCVVYATRANQIWKTENCLRDWNQMYFHSRTDVAFTALAVDWFNPKVLYAGTSDGDILRFDNGAARLVHRVDGVRITSVAVDPRDSRTIYAATDGSGIAKSSDGGATWDDIYKPFQEFDRARGVKAIALDPNQANTVYAVSKYGILKSQDGGATWQALTLPTPPGTVDIRAITVHPKDSKQIVYGTDASIVFTVDGGTSWTAKKLPTKRGVAFLSYDRSPDNNLFLGAPAEKK